VTSLFLVLFTLNQKYILLNLSSDTNSEIKIYFDLGDGEFEENSVSRPLLKGDGKNYLFKFPKKAVRLIRIDPATQESRVRINKIEIRDSFGSLVSKVNFNQIYPVKDIESLLQDGNGLVVQSSRGVVDPILRLANSHKYNNLLNVSNESLTKIFTISVLVPLILLCLIPLANIIFTKLRKVNPLIFKFLKSKPFLFLVIASFLSVLISEYPIVFFNKSHLHYVGIPSLYHGYPYLPGFSGDLRTEDFRGSDIGAAAWSMIPNTFAEIDAITKFGEFPFWNRYVGGGLPLFSQGQSMMGDPLHWVVIAMNGSAVGWDIKFFLSKLFFVLGFAFLSYSISKSIKVSLLIALTLPFIGFYSFRLNHPAYGIYTYSPWIIFLWKRVADSLSFKDHYKTAISICLLTLIVFFHLNSGAPKEAVVLYGFITLTGLIFFFNGLNNYFSYRRIIFIASLIIAVQILFSAPYWLLFVNALSSSYTVYDTFISQTLSPLAFLALFDNIFYQKYTDSIAIPSLNLIFLIFFTFAIYATIKKELSKVACWIWLAFILPGLFVFGFVPEAILRSLPFINRIMHYHNTFASSLLFSIVILSIYGLAIFLSKSNIEKVKYLKFSFSFFLLWGLIFLILKLSLIIYLSFLIIFYLILIYLFSSSSFKKSNKFYLGIALIFFFLLLPKGLNLNSSFDIDKYITNPVERPDLLKKSPALEFLKAKLASNPSRVVGLDDVLFPGIGSMFLIESIIHAEPLRNKDFDELILKANYGYSPWGWARLLDKNDINFKNKRLLDFLGVGYVVADANRDNNLNLKKIYTGDLNIYRRESEFPRAYFTNQVYASDAIKDLNEILGRTENSFAIISKSVYSDFVSKIKQVEFITIQARDYKLTSNTTSFTVDADSAGIIVLNESSFGDDFIFKVNGVDLKPIKVNYFAKGFLVKTKGTYEVSCVYKPKLLNRSIVLMLVSLLSLLVFLIYSCFFMKHKK
jgi:hypothetical protein